jgi:O-antigen/teichoic acid export membrane protein
LVKELSRKIYKDTFLVVISNIINYSSTFVLAVFISRMLGVDVLGQFTYIFAFTAILTVITDFGFSTLLVRKVNEDKYNANTFVKEINLVKVIIGFISIILLLAVIYFISNGNFNLTFTAGISAVIPKAIQSTYESSIRALLNQLIPAIIKSINSLIQLSSAYYLIINKFHLFEILLMILVTETITAVVFRYVNKYLWSNQAEGIRLPEKISLSRVKLLLRESFPFFGKNFLSLSIPRITIVLLGYISSAYAVGVFSAASRFANGIGLISGALFNSYYPIISQPGTTDESKYELSRKFIFYAFGLGLFTSLGLFFLSGLLIDVTFKIEEAKPVLKILSFTVIPILVYTIIHSYLFTVHREKFILLLYSIVWAANIILSIVLISIHNYTGAAIATLLVEYSLMITLLIKFYSLNYKKIADKLTIITKAT